MEQIGDVTFYATLISKLNQIELEMNFSQWESSFPFACIRLQSLNKAFRSAKTNIVVVDQKWFLFLN